MPLPSRTDLEAALAAAYDALAAEHGANPPREAIIATLAEAALSLAAPAVPPQQNPQNITLAELCARANLPIPPADTPEQDAHQLVLRAFKRPTGGSPYWTLTNTGGRKYRFVPAFAEAIERYRGTNWEPVPEHQVPVVVLQLRAAILLAARNKTPDAADQPQPFVQQSLLFAA